MKRDIEKNLIAWKNSKTHIPLILKGARQVGKSYTVKKFGEENFKNCVVVDFDFVNSTGTSLGTSQDGECRRRNDRKSRCAAERRQRRRVCNQPKLCVCVVCVLLIDLID